MKLCTCLLSWLSWPSFSKCFRLFNFDEDSGSLQKRLCKKQKVKRYCGSSQLSTSFSQKTVWHLWEPHQLHLVLAKHCKTSRKWDIFDAEGTAWLVGCPHRITRHLVVVWCYLLSSKSNPTVVYSGASASCGRCARKLRNTATCKANSEGIERIWSGKMQCCKGKGGMGTNENDENILQIWLLTKQFLFILHISLFINVLSLFIMFIVQSFWFIRLFLHSSCWNFIKLSLWSWVLDHLLTEVTTEKIPGEVASLLGPWSSTWLYSTKTAGKNCRPSFLKKTCQTYNI